MAGTIRWYDDSRTILIHEYEGNVTQEDYYSVIHTSAEAISDVSHTVDVVMDRSRVRSLPRDLTRILKYADDKLPENMGIRVVVGASRKTKIMVEIGRIVSPNLVRNVHFADSLEAAVQFIRERAASPESD